jgi:hypothetical protein
MDKQTERRVAPHKKFKYSVNDISASGRIVVPSRLNMSTISITIPSLRERCKGYSRLGEKVLDVGSGLGVDSFIAADAVGPTGSVTGRQCSSLP